MKLRSIGPMMGVIFVATSLASGASPQAPAAATTEKPVEEPAPDLPQAKDKRNLRSFSSAVNVLRQGARVEAVFRNGEIYSLPRGSRQHQIFDVLQKSERTGEGVSVTVDERTGVIESVSGASSGGSAGGGSPSAMDNK